MEKEAISKLPDAVWVRGVRVKSGLPTCLNALLHFLLEPLNVCSISEARRRKERQ